MNRDPLVRLKYSDYYFSLSNVQELRKDEAACCRRFDVVNAKCSQEKAYSFEFGKLLDSIRFIYGSTDSIERQVVYFRETVVRGTRIVALANRIVNSIDRRLPEDKEIIVSEGFKDRDPIEEAKANYDLPLEESLFRLALKTFVAHETDFIDPGTGARSWCGGSDSDFPAGNTAFPAPSGHQLFFNG